MMKSYALHKMKSNPFHPPRWISSRKGFHSFPKGNGFNCREATGAGAREEEKQILISIILKIPLSLFPKHQSLNQIKAKAIKNKTKALINCFSPR